MECFSQIQPCPLDRAGEEMVGQYDVIVDHAIASMLMISERT